MLSVPRLTFALGELGMLPAWFAKVHPRFHTPANSVLLLGALGLAFALSGSFALLATASSLTRMIAYGLSIGALPSIRASASPEDRARAYRLKGGYTIPAIALGLCIWIAIQSPLNAWYITLGMLAFGLTMYTFAQWKNRQQNSAT